MRQIISFSFSPILFSLVVICLIGCTTMKTMPRIDPGIVRKVEVYDYRTGSEQFVTTIKARDKVEQIVQLLDRYEKGWEPVQASVPMGFLVLDYVSNNDSEKMERSVTHYRITPRDIITAIDGKFYGQDISQADQQLLCQIIGLEESFFSEAPTVAEASGAERNSDNLTQ